MKKLIITIFFLNILFSQHIKIPSLIFDHQALIVDNIDASRDFYRDVLLMEEIENKAGDNPPKRWLKNAEGVEMHLIEGKTKKLKHVKKQIKINKKNI